MSNKNITENPFEIKTGSFFNSFNTRPTSSILTDEPSIGHYLKRVSNRSHLGPTASASTSSSDTNYLKLEKFKKAYNGSTTSITSSHITDDGGENRESLYELNFQGIDLFSQLHSK